MYRVNSTDLLLSILWLTILWLTDILRLSTILGLSTPLSRWSAALRSLVDRRFANTKCQEGSRRTMDIGGKSCVRNLSTADKSLAAERKARIHTFHKCEDVAVAAAALARIPRNPAIKGLRQR